MIMDLHSATKFINEKGNESQAALHTKAEYMIKQALKSEE
jgi:hypothetical protein